MKGLKMSNLVLAFLSLAALLGLPRVGAAENQAVEIIKKSHMAFYYPGDDFKAKVLMKLITKDGKERIREMTMLRKNIRSDGDQKYFIYFHRPTDVQGVTFMVWKYPNRDDDRWLFIPAVNLSRRVAANDKRSSFVGSDFAYEDVSGRDIEDDGYSLLKEEKLDGKDCYVVKSTPKSEKSADYRYRVSWIDKTNFLPLKEEYYDRRGDLYKVFVADEIKNIDGFWTIIRRTVKNMQSGHRTEVAFTKVEYNKSIEDDIFTERYLKNPPRKWIQ